LLIDDLAVDIIFKAERLQALQLIGDGAKNRVGISIDVLGKRCRDLQAPFRQRCKAHRDAAAGPVYSPSSHERCSSISGCS
jgi:hypothetical protein